MLARHVRESGTGSVSDVQRLRSRTARLCVLDTPADAAAVVLGGIEGRARGGCGVICRGPLRGDNLDL